MEEAIINSEQSLHYSLKFFIELGVENGFIGTGCWFDINCRMLGSTCITYNIR
jgi:hypothetical protein